MPEAPNWLYEQLPYLYVLIGVFAASGFDLSATELPGLVLAFLGLTVIRLRFNYRLRSSQQIRFRLGALR